MPNLKDQYFNIKNYILFLGIALFSACASIQSPQGGPKDLIPPKILSMTPKDQTKNFNAKKIVIQFDEYFKIQNEQKEFTISPEQEQAPILKIRQKRLEIEFKDSLEKNTTYTLNFGKAIVDVNEGNVVKNLSYVFSTGNEIDSLYISGKVTNALTGEPEIESTVFILPKERDTLLGKKRPSIYTLTDSSGNYKLNNLKKGTYKVYALKETGGGDKIYQQGNDEIGFLKDDLILEKNTEHINLEVFKEINANFRLIDRKINNDGSILLSFNKPLKQPKITVTEPTNLDVSKYLKLSKNNDTAKIWLTDLSFDSVKVAIQDEGKLLTVANLTRGKKDTYTRSIFIDDNIQSGKLNPYKHYTLSFPFPIINADAKKIIFLEDSVRRTNFELIKDSTDFLKYQIKYPWKQKRNYDIKFEDAAFTAIFNAKNKEVSKSFKLETADSYGTLTLNVEVPSTDKSFIVEFIDEKLNPIKSSILNKSDKIIFENYPAGIYYIRVIYDENKNGVWDTGNINNGTQPEKIWYSQTETSLRANWEREEKLIIPLTPGQSSIPKAKQQQNNVPKSSTPTNNNNLEGTGLRPAPTAPRRN
jgi:uncharacterized protein (DUF2141 family)